MYVNSEKLPFRFILMVSVFEIIHSQLLYATRNVILLSEGPEQGRARVLVGCSGIEDWFRRVCTSQLLEPRSGKCDV
jgi:hypothetical protein